MNVKVTFFSVNAPIVVTDNIDNIDKLVEDLTIAFNDRGIYTIKTKSDILAINMNFVNCILISKNIENSKKRKKNKIVMNFRNGLSVIFSLSDDLQNIEKELMKIISSPNIYVIEFENDILLCYSTDLVSFMVTNKTHGDKDK